MLFGIILDDCPMRKNKFLVLVTRQYHWDTSASVIANTCHYRLMCQDNKKDAESKSKTKETSKDESDNTDCNSKSQDDEDHQKDGSDCRANAIRDEILESALTHVNNLGWTRECLIQGAVDAGYPNEAHGMFPSGGYDLVSYFNGKCNKQLLKEMKNVTDNGEREIENPLEFLVTFVQKRIEMIIPYKSQWPQAIGLIALPANAPTSLAQLLTLVDDICYYSGDRSVDVSIEYYLLIYISFYCNLNFTGIL